MLNNELSEVVLSTITKSKRIYFEHSSHSSNEADQVCAHLRAARQSGLKYYALDLSD